MSLASTLAPFIHTKIRKRGVHYFHGGRVRLIACTAEQAQAVVSGSSPYQVDLIREDKSLRSSCSCPFSERGEICKHVWAAILAVDAKGGLRGVDGTWPQRLTAMPAAAEKGVEQARAIPRPQQPTRLASPPSATAPRTPTWRELVDGLDSARTFVPAPAVDFSREILYLLDIPSTLRSQQLTVELMARAKKRDGSWGKLQRLSLRREDVPRLPDPADRKILSLLSGATLGPWPSWYLPTVSNNCEIPAEAAGILLPLL